MRECLEAIRETIQGSQVREVEVAA